jgi:hypothetical protein
VPLIRQVLGSTQLTAPHRTAPHRSDHSTATTAGQMLVCLTRAGVPYLVAFVDKCGWRFVVGGMGGGCGSSRLVTPILR